MLIPEISLYISTSAEIPDLIFSHVFFPLSYNLILIGSTSAFSCISLHDILLVGHLDWKTNLRPLFCATWSLFRCEGLQAFRGVQGYVKAVLTKVLNRWSLALFGSLLTEYTKIGAKIFPFKWRHGSHSGSACRSCRWLVLPELRAIRNLALNSKFSLIFHHIYIHHVWTR